MPATQPSLKGREALAAFYKTERFSIAALRAEVLQRMVVGNKVIDHEKVYGMAEQPYQVVVVYEVQEGLIIENFEELQRPLYRSGNSVSPGFSESRALKDIVTYERAGIAYVKANGNGFSTFDHITTGMKRQGKNVWMIKKAFRFLLALK